MCRLLLEQRVNFVHNVAQFIVGVCRGQFELDDEPVHLVDADGDGHALLNSVFEQTLCVQHHLGRKRENTRVTLQAKTVWLLRVETVQSWEQGERSVTHPLCCVYEEDDAIGDPHAGRDLVREVDVAFEGGHEASCHFSGLFI